VVQEWLRPEDDVKNVVRDVGKEINTAPHVEAEPTD
jgi:hypothetical protein